MRVLVIAEHDARGLLESTARTVTCALGVAGAAVELAVFAADAAALAAAGARIAGVSRVLKISAPAFTRPLAASLAPAIAELAAGYTHVFAPGTTFGRDLMPRVAALLGTVQVSEIMSVEAPNRFTRPIYAGNAIATVEVDGEPVIATARTASFPPAAEAAAAATVAAWQPGAALPAHTRFVSRSSATGDKPDLQSAARVVSGGRGVGSAENFALIEALAEALGAAVGASRAAVDSGFVPNELQVGQTGKIIAPELYIAVGISGAIQHLTGIRDAGTIVAINKDADAPIFELASLGLVADLFTVLPELTEKLRALQR